MEQQSNTKRHLIFTSREGCSCYRKLASEASYFKMMFHDSLSLLWECPFGPSRYQSVSQYQV